MAHLITPVLLAGGRGSRLWPLTGTHRPKPFLRPFSQHSLFQETLARVRDFAPPVVITEEQNFAQAAREAKAMDIHPSFILEPDGRGTAAALITAALSLKETDGLMLVMPCDHFIPDPDGLFENIVQDVMHHAQENIVLLGVEPEGPDPRYGYIEIDRAKPVPYPVFGFKEKPPVETAREMIAEGNYLWNTGMFMAPPALFLERCAALRPSLYNDVVKAFEAGSRDQAAFRPSADLYRDIRAESIDRAILQRCKGLLCCPLGLPWYDVGCWSMFLTLKFRRFMNRPV